MRWSGYSKMIFVQKNRLWENSGHEKENLSECKQQTAKLATVLNMTKEMAHT